MPPVEVVRKEEIHIRYKMTLDTDVKEMAGVIALVHGMNKTGVPSTREGYHIFQSKEMPSLFFSEQTKQLRQPAIDPVNKVRNQPSLVTDLAGYSVGYPFFDKQGFMAVESAKFNGEAGSLFPANFSGAPSSAILSPLGTKPNVKTESVRVWRKFPKKGLAGLFGRTERIEVIEQREVFGEPTPLQHNEIVPYGSSEQAVMLQLRGHSRSYDLKDARSVIRCVNLYVPASLGQRLIQVAGDDPKVFGQIVSDTVHSKLGFDLSYLAGDTNGYVVTPEVVLAPSGILNSTGGKLHFPMDGETLVYDYKRPE